MQSSEFCSICFAPLTLESGLLLCTACGAQSQTYEDESQDFETGVDGARFRRTLKFKVKREQPTEPDNELPPLASLAEAYSLCLQHTLQQACLELQRDLQLNDSLQAVARQLWLTLLGHTGILEEGFASRGDGELEGSQLSTGISPGYKLPFQFFRTALRKVLSPDICLVVLFMACLLLREPIAAVDIVSWTLAGRLSFLKTMSAAVDSAIAEKKLTIAELLHPLGIMGAGQLLQEAARLGEELQINLPPVNRGSLLQRYCMDFAVPLVLVPEALQFLKLRPELEPFLGIRTHVFLDPYSILVAALLASANIYLQTKLNGDERLSEQTWFRRQRLLCGTSAIATSKRNALKMTSPGGAVHFARNLDTLAATIFSSNKAPSSIDERSFGRQPWDPFLSSATPDPRASVAKGEGMDGEHTLALAASWETEYALLLMECASYIEQKYHTSIAHWKQGKLPTKGKLLSSAAACRGCWI